MTFLLPSSTLQRLSTPSVVTCCGKSWANLDALHIFLREFHTDMGACVVQAGEMSKSFGVNTGVKQGCVLAPVIFNLFPVAVTLVFRHNISQMAFASSTGSMAACLISTVCKQRRNNKGHHIRSTIRRRRCPAQPHTRRPAAAAGCISSAYSRAGLVVNSKKTEVLYLPSDSSLLPNFLHQQGSTWPH